MKNKTIDDEILEKAIKMRNSKKEEIEIMDDIDILDDEETNVDKKKKKEHKPNKVLEKIKTWWKNLSKKKKIIIIIISVIILIALILGIVLLVKSHKKVEEEPSVIVEVDNYRYENGTLVFLDNDEEIGRYECDNKDEKKCYVSYYTDDDDFDLDKNEYEDGSKVLLRSEIVNRRYVFVTDSEKEENAILYDITNNSKKEEYKTVKKALNNEFIVGTNNKYKLISLDDEEKDLLDGTFDYLGVYNEKLVKKENNKEYLIDNNGKNLSIGFPYKIKGFNDTYIKTCNEFGEYRIYSYQGKEIFKETYDYIDLQDDYALLIKDKKIYLKFYDNNKLNEKGIELKNDNYNKIKVYDKDKKLVQTKDAYSVSNNDGVISISVTDSENANIVSINKNEGLVSKKTNNLNYFDGILYFYSDKNKDILLGKYECLNKNTITKDSDTLSNCNVSDDSSFANNDLESKRDTSKSPIFNDRYVFITDSSNPSDNINKNISLYDLKQNKTLSNYKAIETFAYTNTFDITFKTVNNYAVICQNKNDKFGVIKINNSDIKGFVGFNYNTLESFKDYYLARNDDGYYLIEKNSGKVVNNKGIPKKIGNITDKYIISHDNDKYAIYDKSGEELSNSYDYIDIYNDFYVGITDGKIGLYTYKDKNNNFTGKEIRIGNDYKNSYKVSTNGNNYTLEVLNNGTFETVASGLIGGE